MKNKMKGKFLLSIATLSLALVSSVGSTFAWFYMNTEAGTSGLDIEVTTGSAVKLKDNDTAIKGRVDYYSDTINIVANEDAKWAAVMPKNITGATTATTDASGSTTAAKEATWTVDSKFQELDVGTVLQNKDKWYYKDVAESKQIDSDETGKKTHIWGTSAGSAAGTSTSTPTAHYFKLDLSYMITTGYDLAISVTENSISVKKGETPVSTGSTDISADKVVRVAFKEQDKTTASVYRIVDTTTEDYSADAMNALIGKSKGETGALTSDMYACNTLSKHLVKESTVTKTNENQTTDKAFYYGKVTIYVWYEGTDHACSNEVFEQTCTFGLTFEASKVTTTTGD